MSEYLKWFIQAISWIFRLYTRKKALVIRCQKTLRESIVYPSVASHSFWVGVLNVVLVLVLSLTAVNFMDARLRAAVKNQMCIDKGCAGWMFRCGREHGWTPGDLRRPRLAVDSRWGGADDAEEFYCKPWPLTHLWPWTVTLCVICFISQWPR